MLLTRPCAGYGSYSEDRRQALPRVLCSNRRGRSRGIPVCDACCSPFQGQGKEEGRELPCFVNGPLDRFSLALCDDGSCRGGMCFPELGLPHFFLLIHLAGLSVGL